MSAAMPPLSVQGGGALGVAVEPADAPHGEVRVPKPPPPVEHGRRRASGLVIDVDDEETSTVTGREHYRSGAYSYVSASDLPEHKSAAKQGHVLVRKYETQHRQAYGGDPDWMDLMLAKTAKYFTSTLRFVPFVHPVPGLKSPARVPASGTPDPWPVPQGPGMPRVASVQDGKFLGGMSRESPAMRSAGSLEPRTTQSSPGRGNTVPSRSPGSAGYEVYGASQPSTWPLGAGTHPRDSARSGSESLAGSESRARAREATPLGTLAMANAAMMAAKAPGSSALPVLSHPRDAPGPARAPLPTGRRSVDQGAPSRRGSLDRGGSPLRRSTTGTLAPAEEAARARGRDAGKHGAEGDRSAPPVRAESSGKLLGRREVSLRSLASAGSDAAVQARAQGLANGQEHGQGHVQGQGHGWAPPVAAQAPASPGHAGWTAGSHAAYGAQAPPTWDAYAAQMRMYQAQVQQQYMQAWQAQVGMMQAWMGGARAPAADGGTGAQAMPCGRCWWCMSGSGTCYFALMNAYAQMATQGAAAWGEGVPSKGNGPAGPRHAGMGQGGHAQVQGSHARHSPESTGRRRRQPGPDRDVGGGGKERASDEGVWDRPSTENDREDSPGRDVPRRRAHDGWEGGDEGGSRGLSRITVHMGAAVGRESAAQTMSGLTHSGNSDEAYGDVGGGAHRAQSVSPGRAAERAAGAAAGKGEERWGGVEGRARRSDGGVRVAGLSGADGRGPGSPTKANDRGRAVGSNPAPPAKHDSGGKRGAGELHRRRGEAPGGGRHDRRSSTDSDASAREPPRKRASRAGSRLSNLSDPNSVTPSGPSSAGPPSRTWTPPKDGMAGMGGKSLAEAVAARLDLRGGDTGAWMGHPASGPFQLGQARPVHGRSPSRRSRQAGGAGAGASAPAGAGAVLSRSRSG